MKAAAKSVLGHSQSIHMLPRWVTSARCQDTDSVTFSSGAALAMLDVVSRDPGTTLPAALLRDRLALEAAAAYLKLEGCNEGPSDIRDAVCLARAGDELGPAGEMFVAWRKVARVNLNVSSWRAQVTKLLPDQVAKGMSEFGAFEGLPVAQASQQLAGVLQRFPRQEAAALMLADITLAHAIGWDRPVPLLAAHLKRADVRAIAPQRTPDRSEAPVLHWQKSPPRSDPSKFASAAPAVDPPNLD